MAREELKFAAPESLQSPNDGSCDHSGWAPNPRSVWSRQSPSSPANQHHVMMSKLGHTRDAQVDTVDTHAPLALGPDLTQKALRNTQGAASSRRSIVGLSLDRFQIRNDGRDIFRGKTEFGHVRMSRDEALSQGFLERFNRIFCAQSAKGRRFGMVTGTCAADCVASCAVPGHQQLSTMSGARAFSSFGHRSKQQARTQPQPAGNRRH